MDWNRDGKVDGHDMVHFHEVINSDSNSAPAIDGNVSGGNGSSKKIKTNKKTLNKKAPNRVPFLWSFPKKYFFCRCEC